MSDFFLTAVATSIWWTIHANTPVRLRVAGLLVLLAFSLLFKVLL